MTAGYTPPTTDLLGWRLKVGEDNHGQHKWVYLPEGEAREAWPQSKMDKYAVGLEMVSVVLAVGDGRGRSKYRCGEVSKKRMVFGMHSHIHGGGSAGLLAAAVHSGFWQHPHCSLSGHARLACAQNAAGCRSEWPPVLQGAASGRRALCDRIRRCVHGSRQAYCHIAAHSQAPFSSSLALSLRYTSPASLSRPSNRSKCGGTSSTSDARKAAGVCELLILETLPMYLKLTPRHTAAPPTVFGTVMNYVSLRLLGMGPDEGPMTEIRALIHEMGKLGNDRHGVARRSTTDVIRRSNGHSELGQGVVEHSGVL